MKLSVCVVLLLVCCAAFAYGDPLGSKLVDDKLLVSNEQQKFESKPIIEENPVFVGGGGGGEKEEELKEKKFEEKPILKEEEKFDKFDKFDKFEKFETKPVVEEEKFSDAKFSDAKLSDEKLKPVFEEAKVLEEMPMLADRLEHARTTGSIIKPLLPLSTSPITVPNLSSKTAKLVSKNMPAAPQPIVKPKNAPILEKELPLKTQWSFVHQPILQKRQNLKTIELTPIMQPYTVSSTTFKQENIKQPITEPVYQPYLQRYMQQAHPVVQPIVQRLVQPVVHRELHSYLQTKSGQAPDAETIIKPTEFTSATNQAIRGADLQALPLSKTVGAQ